MTTTASGILSTLPIFGGSGLVNLRALLTNPVNSLLGTVGGLLDALTNTRWGSGTGSLEKARGSFHVGAESSELRGEVDIFGRAWSGYTWSRQTAGGSVWNYGTWRGERMTGDAWQDRAWPTATWSDADWTGAAWTSDGWSAQTWRDGSWTAQTWRDDGWSAQTWRDHGWSAQTWRDHGWSAQTWRSDNWS
jgi:serine protease AprX